MGNKQGKGLTGVIQRAESRSGKLTISGRYHKLPKRLEDDYVLEKKVLGSGYNGQVHLAENKQTGVKVAVKGFKLHGVPREKREELESEAEIFLSMDHPHVTRLVDVYESEDQLSLVMECMTGGELFKRVTERKRFSEKDGADAAWQMLLAINYIHSLGVVHRDIKLENFLYDNPDSDHLKLIDFGFSKIWNPNTKMALSCGTLAYVAPEVLDQSYTSQCDMWSVGVTIFIVIFGYMPFSGSEDHQMHSIRRGSYTYKADIWKRVSAKAQDFIRKILVVEPLKRLTAEQALEHPWIAERDQMEKSHEAMDQDMVDALISFGQASAFRRAAMQMMAWSLTNEERATVRQAFIELDEDRTGTVTLSEFKKVVEEKFHINDEAAVHAFEALDTNHTDTIHYSEFLAAMVSSRIAIHEHLLQQTFKRFDQEGTGFISAANLRSVIGEKFDGMDVDAIMEEIDSSKDGKISYQEFIAFLRTGGGEEHHQEAVAGFIDNHLKENHPDMDHKIRKKSGVLDSPGNGKDGEKPSPSCCGLQ
mmetsp:Transcript_4484/g.10550  ORF Transcript_4484/g.10550 Transcript_4484/m.10550 type:complete len:533 (+) Transcript_4484:121-1719(+)